MNNPLTQQPIENETLQEISALANIQHETEKAIEVLERQLEELVAKHKEIAEIKLPEAMMAVGMTQFKLQDGTAITVSRFYSASIPKERTEEAFAWLRSHDFSEIIKRNITCKFGKGEDEMATRVSNAIAALGIQAEDKESVHPQTLKAFVREQIEGGKELPLDVLGVYVGNKAKVTPATT